MASHRVLQRPNPDAFRGAPAHPTARSAAHRERRRGIRSERRREPVRTRRATRRGVCPITCCNGDRRAS